MPQAWGRYTPFIFFPFFLGRDSCTPKHLTLKTKLKTHVENKQAAPEWYLGSVWHELCQGAGVSNTHESLSPT